MVVVHVVGFCSGICRNIIKISHKSKYNSDYYTEPSGRGRFAKKAIAKCTKEVEFSFNMFRQIDGVAMESPLGPVLANVFM